jgi:hypothetical protein
LPAARIRRSVSTAYYALFHFLLDEATRAVVGSHHDLRHRRRIFARSFSHSGIKATLAKVSGVTVDASIAALLRQRGVGAAKVVSPRFVMLMSGTFSDVHSQRQDADYDLNEDFDEADARIAIKRVRDAIDAWKAADTQADRHFKNALSMLMLLKGQLRRET